MANCGKETSKVYLEPIEHVYIHSETGQKFTSVTKVISSVEEHFDSDAVAMAISRQSNDRKQEKYIGMSKDDILLEWKRINDEANIYGTNIHELIETYLVKNKFFFPTDEFEKSVVKAYKDVKVDEGRFVYPERIMFSQEYQLAGTADLLFDIDDTYFDIGDFKGLPIETPIFTDSGWKTMGDIDISDRVYDIDGNLSKILNTSNIKNKPCYEIKFDNNEKIVADFEHRWLISFYRDKKFKDVVMTTEELFNYCDKLVNRWSHKIPKIKIAKPLNNLDIKLPIDPYVFGVWLGDGHSADSKITNMCENIWLEIEKRGYTLGDDVSGGGAGKAQTRTIFNMRGKLNKLNLLKNKHLPDIYLSASYNQRLDLLRGLMDADGHYNKCRTRFVMATTREWQRDATVKIVSSLGMKTTVIDAKRSCNGKVFDVFDICFSTDNINPFLSRNEIGVKYGKQNNLTFKNIVSVKKVDSVPTRCIEVDSPSRTFLYGHGFSVTHNTNRLFNYYSKYGKTLLAPFDHLQECQFSVYSLQLSVYALMYEMETGKKCRQLFLLYWDRETLTFSRIQLLYLKMEAQKLLDLHKYKVNLEGK